MFWILCFCAILAISGSVNIPTDFNFNVPKDFKAPDEILSAISDNIANKFAQEYLIFHKTGVESPILKEISRQLAEMHSEKDIFTKEPEELGAADSFFLCTTCRATARVAAHMVRDEDGELNGPNGDENAKQLVLEFCKRFDVQTEEVCLGLYESNWPVIKYIAVESKMDSRTFCSLFMEWNFCKVPKNSEYNFTLTIDASNAPVSSSKNKKPEISEDNVAILHISDLHYDPLYLPGSMAGCREPLCCQRYKDVSEGTSMAAGYWGDYRDCDAPWHMIENALEHIKRTHKKIDFIYQTGDVVDHMVWATSKEKNIEILKKVDDTLEKMFPGVKVYSCIGNHEPHPVNIFSPEDAPEELSSKWLYEFLYSSWSRWLPKSTEATIMRGGYYTDSPRSGFRVIALNNNECHLSNWWFFYQAQNKIPQLQWLHDTLLAAEKAKEFVHILTHIPTGGGSCWSVWSREFNRIVERFSHIISGIFNGHTHKDEMAVHYSQNGHAVNIVWNGGSITPASNKNPNYRFYYMDKNSLEVAQPVTWFFNLTDANLNGSENPPKWQEMYDFRKEFTTDLSPYGIDQLLDKFAEQPNMLRKYWEYQSTMADPRLKWGCDRECLMYTICRIATTVSDQLNRCLQLQTKLSKSLDAEDTTTTTTTSTTTMKPTTTTTTTTENPAKPNAEDNGAASVIATSLSSIITLFIVLRHFL